MSINNQFEPHPESSGPLGPRLIMWGVVGIFVAALVAGSVNLLVPRSVSRAGGHLRIGWYLRSNQWKGDVRTAAAVVRYVLDRGFQPGLNGTPTPVPRGSSVVGDFAGTNNLIQAPTA